jgi:hypothetical protein
LDGGVRTDGRTHVFAARVAHLARAAASALHADCRTVADGEAFSRLVIVSHRDDPPDDLMAWDEGERGDAPSIVDLVHVRVADPTVRDRHVDVSCRRRG